MKNKFKKNEEEKKFLMCFKIKFYMSVAYFTNNPWNLMKNKIHTTTNTLRQSFTFT